MTVAAATVQLNTMVEWNKHPLVASPESELPVKIVGAAGKGHAARRRSLSGGPQLPGTARNMSVPISSRQSHHKM